MMNVGDIYKLSDSWDKESSNDHIKEVYPDLKSDVTIEILKVDCWNGTKCPTSIKIIKTGQICDINNVFGYWCFFVEHDIFLKQAELIKKNNIPSYIDACKLIISSMDEIVLSKDEINTNLYSIDKLRRNLNWLENDLLNKLVETK